MDKNQNAVALFNKLATVYESKYMDVSMYSAGLDLFCKTVKKNATVLELACGPGNITRYLLDRRPDLKIIATDLAPNMIDLAQVNNPEATFKLLNCKDLLALERKFDAVICGFCLPYLDKTTVLKLIEDISSVINPEGLFYLSAIAGDYEQSEFKKSSSGEAIFMHYYDSIFLTNALEQNHFTLLKIENIVSKASDGTKVTDLAFVAQK